MNKNDLSIATITLVRNDSEEELLRASLRQLAEINIPVFITDGGSNRGFLNFLQSFTNSFLSQTKVQGVYFQAKNSLVEAYQSGSAFIFYTEPDKKDFFQKGLPGMLKKVSVDNRAGIITASRSAAAFETFPAFQRMTETTINNCCREIIGYPADYTYGPFILNSQLVHYLKSENEDIGWGWRPFIFSAAHRSGLEVESFEGDFFCPADQQKDSPAERIYRMRQLSQNIQGLVLSTHIPQRYYTR